MLSQNSEYSYPVIFEPEDSGYSIYVPDIDGCMTQAETIEEGLKMVYDAIGLALEGMVAEQYPIPSSLKDIQLKNQQFVKMVVFNPQHYEYRWKVSDRLQAAIENGEKIAVDPNVKGYHNMEELRKALEVDL